MGVESVLENRKNSCLILKVCAIMKLQQFYSLINKRVLNKVVPVFEYFGGAMRSRYDST